MEAREIGDRRCLRCGAELECKLKDFSIGADGGGGLMALLADQYEVDLFACPACGKVELFTAGFSTQPPPEEEIRLAAYWCDYCQKGREDQLCPVCQRVGVRMEDHLAQLKKKKRQSQEPSEPPEPVDRRDSARESERRFPWQKKKVPWEK